MNKVIEMRPTLSRVASSCTHDQAIWVLSFNDSAAAMQYIVHAEFDFDKDEYEYIWFGVHGDNIVDDVKEYKMVDEERHAKEHESEVVFLKKSCAAFGFNTNYFREMEARFEAMNRICHFSNV